MSQVDTRQLERDSLFLLAHLRLEDQGQTYRVKVRNLSSGGMMGEGEVRVAQGMSLQVELRNIGWISGTVAWTADGRFGVAFAEEIDPKKVRAQITVGGGHPDAPRFTRLSQPPPVPSPAKLRKI